MRNTKKASYTKKVSILYMKSKAITMKDIDDFLLVGRTGGSSVVHDNRYIITIGGHNGKRFLDKVEMHDMATKTKHRLPNLNFPRGYHDCTMIKKWKGSIHAIICVGGMSTSPMTSIEILIFSKLTKRNLKWCLMEEHLSTVNVESVFRYFLMIISLFPQPRYGLSLISPTIRGIIAVGGRSNSNLGRKGQISAEPYEKLPIRGHEPDTDLADILENDSFGPLKLSYMLVTDTDVPFDLWKVAPSFNDNQVATKDNKEEFRSTSRNVFFSYLLLGGHDETGNPTKIAFAMSAVRKLRTSERYNLPKSIAFHFGVYLESLNVIYVCGGFNGWKFQLTTDHTKMEGSDLARAEISDYDLF